MNNKSRAPRRAARSAGFSLVEMMVAMVVGLAVVIGISSVYLFSKSSARRQEQIGTIQQSVRVAFEYLAGDARMVGHLGCFTGRDTGFVNDLGATTLPTNYALGIEGYDYATTGSAFAMTSNAPANTTTTAEWRTNTDANGVVTVPIATLAGSATGDGLTPGSDVLVIRTVLGAPLRLTAATTASNQLLIENIAGGGKCSNGTTDKMSGFCVNSQALVASCTEARVFPVAAVDATTGALTTGGSNFGSVAPGHFAPGASEVFPLQTIAYYIKASSSGTTTSLYRRVFDGDVAAGTEQELIEGVENLQLLYGRDTTLPDPDGKIDDYVVASDVGEWSKVVAVRMALVIRADAPVGADTPVAASAPVNGISVSFPASAPHFDRRVFTTTVALRNRLH